MEDQIWSKSKSPPIQTGPHEASRVKKLTLWRDWQVVGNIASTRCVALVKVLLHPEDSFHFIPTSWFSVMEMSPKACYRSGSTAGGTPQRSWVRSPSGANFSSGVKKTPSLVPRPKHCGARPNSQGDGPPCTGGAGVRGFSWPAVRRSFYLSNNAVGAVLPPAGQVFFFKMAYSNNRYISYMVITVSFVASTVW